VKFPQVTGNNLQRQKVYLPQDFEGKCNIVFIAFLRWQQASIDSWMPFVSELEKANEYLRYYELPTIQRLNWFSRTFINEGMRAGIPDRKARTRTITLYLDKQPFMAALQIPHEAEISVLLISKDGEVLWRTMGAFTPEKGQAMQAVINEKCKPS
jgi:hypothetical protein